MVPPPPEPPLPPEPLLLELPPPEPPLLEVLDALDETDAVPEAELVLLEVDSPGSEVCVEQAATAASAIPRTRTDKL